MSAMASQITGASIVSSTVCSGAYQRKHQGSVSLAFVRGIHQWLVDSPQKGPVTRKIFQGPCIETRELSRCQFVVAGGTGIKIGIISVHRNTLTSRDSVNSIRIYVMSVMASLMTDNSNVRWTVCPGSQQIKLKRFTLVAQLRRGIHRWRMDSPHKGPITRRVRCHDVIMYDTVKHDTKVSIYRRVYLSSWNMYALLKDRSKASLGLWQVVIHESHNSPVPYPTMHHSKKKRAYFCFVWCIVGYKSGAWWELWDCSIDVNWKMKGELLSITMTS